MPEKPPALNPAPPKDCSADGVVNEKETRLAMMRWSGKAHFACGHRRVPASTWLGMLSDREVENEARNGAAVWQRGLALDELASRRRQCRGCENANRRARNHWAAFAVAAALLLLVAWRCW